MAAPDNLGVTIECLKHSIEDTQEIIRGYDTKAEILAVILTLASGITNYTNYPKMETHPYLVFTSWLLTLIAIFFLGMVLYPKKNQFKSIQMGTFVASEVYYIHSLANSPQNTVSNLAQKAIGANWTEELMYESMKLSLIRDRKHWWVLWSIRLVGLALLFIWLPIGMGAFCVK